MVLLGLGSGGVQSSHRICCGVMGVAILLKLALVIGGAVFVYLDATTRGDPNKALWVILVCITTLVGLIIYFVARPKGNVVECGNCRRKKLETLPSCPRCGELAGGPVR